MKKILTLVLTFFTLIIVGNTLFIVKETERAVMLRPVSYTHLRAHET